MTSKIASSSGEGDIWQSSSIGDESYDDADNQSLVDLDQEELASTLVDPMGQPYSNSHLKSRENIWSGSDNDKGRRSLGEVYGRQNVIARFPEAENGKDIRIHGGKMNMNAPTHAGLLDPRLVAGTEIEYSSAQSVSPQQPASVSENDKEKDLLSFNGIGQRDLEKGDGQRSGFRRTFDLTDVGGEDLLTGESFEDQPFIHSDMTSKPVAGMAGFQKQNARTSGDSTSISFPKPAGGEQSFKFRRGYFSQALGEGGSQNSSQLQFTVPESRTGLQQEARGVFDLDEEDDESDGDKDEDEDLGAEAGMFNHLLVDPPTLNPQQRRMVSHVGDGAAARVKLLCSYGGMIVPKPGDGKLRYVGGETRIMVFFRNITYKDLMVKMKEHYGQNLTLKYQLPNEDLDALVTVSSDEDLVNMMEEYDHLQARSSTGTQARLRVFLYAVEDPKAQFMAVTSGNTSTEYTRYFDAVNSRSGTSQSNLQALVEGGLFETKGYTEDLQQGWASGASGLQTIRAPPLMQTHQSGPLHELVSVASQPAPQLDKLLPPPLSMKQSRSAAQLLELPASRNRSAAPSGQASPRIQAPGQVSIFLAGKETGHGGPQLNPFQLPDSSMLLPPVHVGGSSQPGGSHLTSVQQKLLPPVNRLVTTGRYSGPPSGHSSLPQSGSSSPAPGQRSPPHGRRDDLDLMMLSELQELSLPNSAIEPQSPVKGGLSTMVFDDVPAGIAPPSPRRQKDLDEARAVAHQMLARQDAPPLTSAGMRHVRVPSQQDLSLKFDPQLDHRRPELARLNFGVPETSRPMLTDPLSPPVHSESPHAPGPLWSQLTEQLKYEHANSTSSVFDVMTGTPMLSDVNAGAATMLGSVPLRLGDHSTSGPTNPSFVGHAAGHGAVARSVFPEHSRVTGGSPRVMAGSRISGLESHPGSSMPAWHGEFESVEATGLSRQRPLQTRQIDFQQHHTDSGIYEQHGHPLEGPPITGSTRFPNYGEEGHSTSPQEPVPRGGLAQQNQQYLRRISTDEAFRPLTEPTWVVNDGSLLHGDQRLSRDELLASVKDGGDGDGHKFSADTRGYYHNRRPSNSMLNYQDNNLHPQRSGIPPPSSPRTNPFQTDNLRWPAGGAQASPDAMANSNQSRPSMSDVPLGLPWHHQADFTGPDGQKLQYPQGLMASEAQFAAVEEGIHRSQNGSPLQADVRGSRFVDRGGVGGKGKYCPTDVLREQCMGDIQLQPLPSLQYQPQKLKPFDNGADKEQLPQRVYGQETMGLPDNEKFGVTEWGSSVEQNAGFTRPLNGSKQQQLGRLPGQAYEGAKQELLNQGQLEDMSFGPIRDVEVLPQASQWNGAWPRAEASGVWGTRFLEQLGSGRPGSSSTGQGRNVENLSWNDPIRPSSQANLEMPKGLPDINVRLGEDPLRQNMMKGKTAGQILRGQRVVDEPKFPDNLDSLMNVGDLVGNVIPPNSNPWNDGRPQRNGPIDDYGMSQGFEGSSNKWEGPTSGTVVSKVAKNQGQLLTRADRGQGLPAADSRGGMPFLGMSSEVPEGHELPEFRKGPGDNGTTGWNALGLGGGEVVAAPEEPLRSMRESDGRKWIWSGLSSHSTEDSSAVEDISRSHHNLEKNKPYNFPDKVAEDPLVAFSDEDANFFDGSVVDIHPVPSESVGGQSEGRRMSHAGPNDNHEKVSQDWLLLNDNRGMRPPLVKPEPHDDMVAMRSGEVTSMTDHGAIDWSLEPKIELFSMGFPITDNLPYQPVDRLQLGPHFGQNQEGVRAPIEPIASQPDHNLSSPQLEALALDLTAGVELGKDPVVDHSLALNKVGEGSSFVSGYRPELTGVMRVTSDITGTENVEADDCHKGMLSEVSGVENVSESQVRAAQTKVDKRGSLYEGWDLEGKTRMAESSLEPVHLVQKHSGNDLQGGVLLAEEDGAAEKSSQIGGLKLQLTKGNSQEDIAPSTIPEVVERVVNDTLTNGATNLETSEADSGAPQSDVMSLGTSLLERPGTQGISISGYQKRRERHVAEDVAAAVLGGSPLGKSPLRNEMENSMSKSGHVNSKVSSSARNEPGSKHLVSAHAVAASVPVDDVSRTKDQQDMIGELEIDLLELAQDQEETRNKENELVEEAVEAADNLISPLAEKRSSGEDSLQRIPNADLEELRELGSGTYGTVFYGKWRGTDVAIKRIKATVFEGHPEQDRLINDFWREACILGALHHPNVVAFYGVVNDGPGESLATVTEYMVNGSLKQVLSKKDRSIDRRKRILIAMDAAFGMEYLHSKNIVHFDLKCDNLLVNLRDPQRPICKVGDLGLSKLKHKTMVSGGVRGTLPWMAPELLDGRSALVTEKVDVFSFGICMWELLTAEEPYAHMHYGAIIGGILNNTLRPPIPSWCDPAWKALMERCWSGDPSQRPTFQEVANELRMMTQPTKTAREPLVRQLSWIQVHGYGSIHGFPQLE